MKIYRRKADFMYLMKFDEEGKKISAVPLVLADDWGGVEKLENEGYIEVSDEDWNYILVIVEMVIMIQDI